MKNSSSKYKNILETNEQKKKTNWKLANKYAMLGIALGLAMLLILAVHSQLVYGDVFKGLFGKPTKFSADSVPTITPMDTPSTTPTDIPSDTPISPEDVPQEISQAPQNTIDCIGPDGKHLQVTQTECDNFNASWQPTPTPTTAYVPHVYYPYYVPVYMPHIYTTYCTRGTFTTMCTTY